jgi:hypothetical protein
MLGGCEFLDATEPSTLRAVLRVTDRDGYWWVECNACDGVWQVPYYASDGVG